MNLNRMLWGVSLWNSQKHYYQMYGPNGKLLIISVSVRMVKFIKSKENTSETENNLQLLRLSEFLQNLKILILFLIQITTAQKNIIKAL